MSNKISKNKALKLINEKISQFQKVLDEATYDNRHNEDYTLAFSGTENLLTEIFSNDEGRNFMSDGAISFRERGKPPPTRDEELQKYKKHINNCITELKVYRERIENFWEDNDKLETAKNTKIIPFVSMSFDEEDRDINEYVTGILDALQIEFETGERYSKDSIPEKVKKRILNSDFFIVIFVKRDKIESGGYATPSWLLKELGIAQGTQKEVIPWVEQGIKDIAGLNYEKEIIYFVRDDLKEMKNATIKFLEALKEHELI